ncbi:Eco29kI family restriction endonuclease [Nesterenkonia aerolata]|uniref:Eco29kI family restriction endonuclease n=1 Tax=Nesterenkonia aerolata TaxID=3074079 RepID=A0ABU2DV65_9MICC|nr:Eco29kI family restriction endonuclease [Nesterenkonia sp. LY-0111]MDR8020402.1 Eco29kI family restriction endonuclease [Nesterenkonia sp. LY-0111]
MTKHFDPLDYDNLGASIARALEEQPVRPLENLEKFDGAGIYALYYTGQHPAYQLLAAKNREQTGTRAIYIGKADAENKRKGDPEEAKKPVGPKLFGRITKHRRSIEDANNLDVADFQVRALTIMPTWIPLAEVVAIRMHEPVWNGPLDGLGNNDPGAGRRAGMKSRWDTIHPGRPWADLLAQRRETAENIEQDAIEYLAARISKCD